MAWYVSVPLFIVGIYLGWLAFGIVAAVNVAIFGGVMLAMRWRKK